MENYPMWITIAIACVCLLGFMQIEQSSSQNVSQNMTNLPTNITELFNDKFSRNALDAEVKKQLARDIQSYSLNAQVSVEYESPTSVLISGALITDNDLIFNTFLFQGMDLLKNQYGFKLQDVFTSGQGSKGNPTTVYILMTK